uniref:type III secretion system gatekeeper subunit SctW n=1 Tax=Yersinia frederiksenii TaxID=29484 RepID=UPI001F4C4343|nr:type III secretion system gatekeeper subunit SctW [Yersinia frederiksenii]
MQMKSNNPSDSNVSLATNSAGHGVSELADETPASEQWKFLQSTDEMSAAITQFYNRKLYEKRTEESSSDFECILEEYAESKADKILKIVQNQKVDLSALVDFVHKLFPDDSDLVLILRELIRRNKIDKIVNNKLQEILEQVEMQADRKFINSGTNCALKSKLFGKILSLHPKILRASYRDFLLNESSPVDVYIDWISNFGYKKREHVLEFIEGSLLCDINSLDASCSTVEFGFFLQKLCQLQLLQAAERLFIKHLISNNTIKKLNFKEDFWLFFLLSILKKPESIDIVFENVLAKKLILVTRKETSILHMTLYRGFQMLPTSIFSEEGILQHILEYMRGIIGNSYTIENI